MSVRMRHTRGHTNNRRSHHALAVIKTVEGEKSVRLPHRVDEATGLYRGKQIAAAPKPKKAEAQKHDHPHGTHHEHVVRDERDEKKPVEAVEAEQQAPQEDAQRSPRRSVQDPGN